MTFREIRKSKGLLVGYVAGYLGIKPQSLSQRELGQVKFNAREVQLLCMLYNVDIADVELV